MFLGGFSIFKLHPSLWPGEMPHQNGFYFYPGPFFSDHAQRRGQQIPGKYYSSFAAGFERRWRQRSRSRSVSDQR